MATYPDSNYKMYRVSGLPAGLFGLTYVVAVAIHTSGDHYKGEFYVITSRPPELYQGGFRFSAFEVPPEFMKIDLDFILDEAWQRAQMFLLDKIEDKAKELNKPDLLALPVDLEECDIPFVSFRLHGAFESEIIAIRDSTESEALERYLDNVLKIKGRFVPLPSHRLTDR